MVGGMMDAITIIDACWLLQSIQVAACTGSCVIHGRFYCLLDFERFVPIIVLFDICFEVGNCSTIRAEEIRPCLAVENRPNALVMPNVRARCHE
jgi:hypothetical protein